MKREILIISAGRFLAVTLRDLLKGKKIEAVEIAPVVRALDKSEGDAAEILVILGKFPEDEGMFMHRLHQMAKNGKELFLLGEASEIEDFKAEMPDVSIAKEFKRPVNTADVAESIRLYFDMKLEPNRRQREILVIDDDPLYLRTIRGYLSDTYSVKMATSGMDGIRYIDQHRPDLVLIDYEMPVAKGDTIAEMLYSNQDTKDIPIMFLTGKDDKEIVMKLLRLQPEGYLLKTLPGVEIHKRIDAFFDERD